MIEAVDSPNQLIDIIPPVVPAAVEQSGIGYIILAVVLVALLSWGIWFIWRWYHSERQQSLRGLNRLQAALYAQELSPRDVSYWLAALVKRRLGIHYVSPEVTPSIVTNETQRWRRFMQRLHEVRYAPQPGVEQDITDLLAEAKYWMRQWP